VNKVNELPAFAARLNEVCTDKQLPLERGRQTELAAIFGVSPNAARKWLRGDGLPELSVAIKIAKWAGVHVEWLLSGRGPKRIGVDAKSLVLGEVIQELPEADRQQALDFVRYKVERSSSVVFTGDKLARYMVMLDAFAAAPKPPRPAPPKKKT
jgi:transcriptional regulator with XRE-family HTH domain